MYQGQGGVMSIALAELAGWTGFIVSLVAHVRIRTIRRWMRHKDVERQSDLLSIAQRIEPHGPASDGLPPPISRKFRRGHFHE